ncbi:MAG: hypothetical protein JRI25_20665 [Deltaproteobacteria bacterium]|nr:hypothetical protein [Deltaproteobacteria bacterium]
MYEQRLDSVVADLAWLSPDMMLFGAGVLSLYLDQSDVADDLRPTEDVDAMLRLSGFGDRPAQVVVRGVEKELREHGWSPDLRPHRRNPYAYISPSNVAVDFVFAELCPPDDWVVFARQTAIEHRLSSGRIVRIPTPALFLVCKAEASRNPERWEGAYDSHDIEDIALLMGGCSVLAESLKTAPPEAAQYLSAWAQELLAGATTYGQQAYASLEGNWPRQVSSSRIDDLLHAMASLA